MWSRSPNIPGWENRIWERLSEELAQGRQGFVVCAAIDTALKGAAGIEDDPDALVDDAEAGAPPPASVVRDPRAVAVASAARRTTDRAVAWADVVGREGRHDARFRGRIDRCAGRDDGDRGGRRCAERVDHGGAGCRPVRCRAAAPVAGSYRSRWGAGAGAVRDSCRAGDDRARAGGCGGSDSGRFRSRAGRPRVAAGGQRAGREPVGWAVVAEAVARGARWRPDRGGADRCGGACSPRTPTCRRTSLCGRLSIVAWTRPSAPSSRRRDAQRRRCRIMVTRRVTRVR